jgi:RHS repeat-associated protein
MSMPGRKWVHSDYRYGFNNKEKDDEVKGSGNSYDFGARMYDPRLGRWLTVDPLSGKFIGFSPYCFVANSPIRFKDGDGRDIVDANGNKAVIINKSGQIEFTKFATSDIKTVVNAMNKTEIGKQVAKSMATSNNHIKIVIETEKRGYYDPKTATSSNEKTEGAVEMFAETKPDKLNGEELPDVTITIFKKAIDDFDKLKPSEAYEEKVSGKKVYTSDYKKEDVIGAKGVHEGTHATDKKSNINTNPNSTKAEREAKPEQNELKHYEQTDKKPIHD